MGEGAIYTGRIAMARILKKFARLPGIASTLRWSPDGRVLRFTVQDLKTNAHSLWGVLADVS